jgi:hypothetical protein
MSEELSIPTVEQVFESMDALFGIIDVLDDNYKMYNNNYIMRHFKNKGVSLRTIFLSDILDWLCFLGWSDNNIADSEIKFINALLNLELSQLDVFEIIKNLDVETLTTLPLTFAIFMEYAAVSDDVDENIVEALFSLFMISGTYLIVSDGNVDENEVRGFKGYMDTLRRNIDRFDLESLHEYILDQI